jgi:virulence-associated protein VagC
MAHHHDEAVLRPLAKPQRKKPTDDQMSQSKTVSKTKYQGGGLNEEETILRPLAKPAKKNALVTEPANTTRQTGSSSRRTSSTAHKNSRADTNHNHNNNKIQNINPVKWYQTWSGILRGGVLVILYLLITTWCVQIIYPHTQRSSLMEQNRNWIANPPMSKRDELIREIQEERRKRELPDL